MSALFGLLNLDKPAGMTSRDAVNVVQRLVRPARVGHAGTLDPLATGVLVVCVGPATRLIPFLQDGRKTYRATFRFGVASESDDLEREVVTLEDAPRPTQRQIEQTLPEFLGAIEQVPPVYSAVHVAGRRAYELARQGKPVTLAGKTVEIHRFELMRFDEATQELDAEIECGAGTYIRSLGRDLADRLGTAAVMTALRRTAVGPFRVEEALGPRGLNGDAIAAGLLPPEAGLGELPRVELDDVQIASLQHGRFVPRPPGTSLTNDEPVAIFTHADRFIAVARFDSRNDMLRPKIVFPADEPHL